MSTSATDDADAAQRAWEREMEMAVEGRGRTRSRSILATHEDEDEGDASHAQRDDADSGDRRSSSRRGGHLEPLDTAHTDEPTRAKSGSMERPVPVDIVDGGHDPNWLNSPASTDGDENVGRGRARSFTAKRTMELDEESDRAAAAAGGRRRSRSFSSLNRDRSGDDDGDGDQHDEDEMAKIVRRATSLSKIYLVGSAPVDVSKLQDESKIVGVKKVEVVEPTGALSTKALDALSEGLQSLSVDGVSGTAMSQTTGSKDDNSLLSEAEMEEKRMADEEDKKLRNQKLSTRRTFSEKASFFKAKVFKATTGKTSATANSNTSPPQSSAASKPTSGSSSSSATSAATSRGALASSGAASATSGAGGKSDGAADDQATSPAPPPAPVKRHKLKLLLLGDSGVGKTSLMRVFSGDEFSESMLATAGVDFKLRNIAVEEDEIALQIWDTAGQERFHRITATYYKGANGIVLVYDVSDKKSFDNVGYWMNNIRQYASPNMPAMLLVGNKIDLPHRVVSTEEGLAAARQYNVRFIETSAKTSVNTNGALETIARDAFFISLNPTMTQKTLMEKEKSLLGRRNKENCVIS